ncbi:DUF6477 family protein [Cereibacter sphaeroides]|uniref:DUF6477 family protein n=1 Tax=Cereibacter sphaeroides TaxID=1063 RepID=UPI000191C183|nr:DUF6477 family protein [Cereibacter sphaeroides]ACM01013.1 Hypothetical Protein RSKD131_1153 [Cereibacter sphaeroides KD131]
MTDMHGLLAEIRRPRLLMRAARLGLADYRRERDLRRLVPDPEPGRAVAALLAEERDLERRRRAGDATYSVAHHVEVLIALIAEARLAPPAACPLARGAGGGGRLAEPSPAPENDCAGGSAASPS